MAFRSAITSRASLVAIVVLSGAAILGMMGRARTPETALADVQLPLAAPVESPAFEAPQAIVGESERVPAKATPPPAEPRTVAAATAPAPLPPPPPAPLSALTPEPSPTELTPPSAAATEAIETSVPATTITGCLTFDDGNYRLKDVSGADAPKSRSWKSGFLTKRTATIDVVDAAHSLGLANYVGKRVEATGTLTDREMQVRSLERLADSCRR